MTAWCKLGMCFLGIRDISLCNTSFPGTCSLLTTTKSLADQPWSYTFICWMFEFNDFLTGITKYSTNLLNTLGKSSYIRFCKFGNMFKFGGSLLLHLASCHNTGIPKNLVKCPGKDKYPPMAINFTDTLPLLNCFFCSLQL